MRESRSPERFPVLRAPSAARSRALAAREVTHLLSIGTWTHDHPLQRAELETLGLPVRIGIGDDERELLDLFSQPRGREAAVEYVPAAPAHRRRRVRGQPRR